MTGIHKLSSVKALPEFDIFTVPPTQSTIEQDILTEHRPVSTLDSKTFIEFNFTSGIDEYIRLDKTWLYLRLRVTIEKPLKTKVAKEDWKEVSTVNNLLNSIFKSIDFSIGDKLVGSNHQTYPYKTDIEIKLGKSKEIKDTLMQSAFWFEEGFEDPTTLNENISKLIMCDKDDELEVGREFELMGKIYLPMFEQRKALAGGCSLRLKLIPNDPSFYMMATNNVRVKTVDFTDCALFVHRSKISRPVLEGHLKGFEIANAKYPIRESFVVPVTITKGTMDTFIDNIHNGQLPNRAIVCMVDHTDFNGSYLKYPYNYKNNGLKHLSFYLNGIQCPEKPFTPDFEKDLFVREYVSTFEATNQDNIDSCITIKRSNFKNGNNIFAVNFAPDLGGCCSRGYVNPIKHGQLRLQVRFSKALENTITLLIYLDYDSLVELDKDRNIATHFI